MATHPSTRRFHNFYWADLWWLAAIRPRERAWRTELAAALCSLSLGLLFLAQTLQSPFLIPGLISLMFAVIVGRPTIGPRPVFFAMAVILGSLVIAIPGSLVWGEGAWELTALVAVLVAPLIGFYLVGSERVFRWLAPLFLLHALVVLYQGVIVGTQRAQGLTSTPNPAGGLLTLGAVYFLTSRHKWLALPMMAALPFTASRTAMLAMAVVLVLLLLTRRLSWRYLVVGALVASVMVVGAWGAVETSLRMGIRYDPVDNHIMDRPFPVWSMRDLTRRFNIERLPTAAPGGFVNIGDGPPHNVPLRLGIELGLFAAVAWVGVTWWALKTRPRSSGAWWLLLTIVLLGMLDYYTWIGPMAGFWWLLIGVKVAPAYLKRVPW